MTPGSIRGDPGCRSTRRPSLRSTRSPGASHTSAGPVQKVIEVAGADAVRTALTTVLEADRKPDGELRQDNVFRYVIAAKP